MNEFDTWFQDFKKGRNDHEWLEAMKPALQSAWNASLDKAEKMAERQTPKYSNSPKRSISDLKSHKFKHGR